MKRIIAILAVVPLLTMCSRPMMGRWDGYENYSCAFGFGHGSMFMWILFLISLGVAIYFIIKKTRSKNSGGQSLETPLDILKKRYAKGEISKEDFDRMKKDVQ